MSSNLLGEDLLFPSVGAEAVKHTKKKLIPSPNSEFWDIKCPDCFKITPAFSHAKTNIVCSGCNVVLGSPTGGKLKLKEGTSFRVKDK